MIPYKTVYFDIVGFCNARCPYCLTGGRREQYQGVIAPELFECALTRLQRSGAIDSGSIISLYNWGEPLLHPGLHEIVGILNKLGLRYAISTNASKIPVVDDEMTRNLDHAIFSLSGFSQESYNRIHGFNIETIKRNIITYTDACRAHGFRGDFIMFYHVYRFNTGELKACEKFATRHGIIFSPYHAILNHWHDLSAFSQGALPPGRVKEISDDLFGLDEMAEIMRRSPAMYQCPQHGYLTITEKADILVCCQTPKDDNDVICGNILRDEMDDIVKKKTAMLVCRECIRSGLAYYINTSMATPSWYRRSWGQYILSLKRRARKLLH